MSRVTLEQHHYRYRLLWILWHESSSIFGLLSPAAQWEIHEAYAITQDFDRDDLQAHLAMIRRTDPSLLSRAGKHYRRIETVYTAIRDQGVSPAQREEFSQALLPYLLESGAERSLSVKSSTKGRRVVTTAIMRPKPDVEKLAKALVVLARQIEAERAQDQASDDKKAA